MFCVDGVEATGVVVMCLRKLQNWALSAAFAEYLRFSSEVAMPEALERFVSVEFGAGAEPRSKKESAAASDRQSLLALDSSLLDESSVGAVVVRETVPAWLWGGLRSPALLHAALAHQADQQQQQGADAAAAAAATSTGNTSANPTATATAAATASGLGITVDPSVLAEPATAAAAVAAAAAAAASGGKPHPSVRLRHVPPLFAFDNHGLLNLVDSQQRLGLSVSGAQHHHHHHGGSHGSGPHGTKSGGRSHDAALTMVPGKMTAVKRSEMMIGDSVKLRKPTSSGHRSGNSSSGGGGSGMGGSASSGSGTASGSGSGLDLFSLNQSGALGSDVSSSSSGGNSSGNHRVRGASNDATVPDSLSSKNVFGAASLDGTMPPGGGVSRGGPASNSGSVDGGLDHSSRSGRSGGGGAGDTGSRDGSEQWSESGSRGGGLDDGDGFGSDGGGSEDDDEGGDSGGEYGHHLSPGGSFRRGGHRRGPQDHSQQFIRDFSDRALAQQQQVSVLYGWMCTSVARNLSNAMSLPRTFPPFRIFFLKLILRFADIFYGLYGPHFLCACFTERRRRHTSGRQPHVVCCRAGPAVFWGHGHRWWGRGAADTGRRRQRQRRLRDCGRPPVGQPDAAEPFPESSRPRWPRRKLDAAQHFGALGPRKQPLAGRKRALMSLRKSPKSEV